MDNAFACGQPLCVALAEPRPSTQRVGVVNHTRAHIGDGFKAAVRMRWKARYVITVVHVPTINARKILTDLAAVKRRVGPQRAVALGVVIEMMGTKQERIKGAPLRSQTKCGDHRRIFGGGGGRGIRCAHAVSIVQAATVRALPTAIATKPAKSPKPLSRGGYVLLLATVMALPAIGIDMMLPAFDEMRVSMGMAPNSPAIAQTITAYLLGMAVGQLLFGPLTDRIGRRKAALSGIGIYIVASIGAALATTFTPLLMWRFIWGIGAAAGRVVVTAIVRDTFEGDQMARMMSTLLAVFLLVPIVAPSLGAVIADLGPWRWVFWASGLLAAAIGLLVLFRLPETLPDERRKPIRIDVLRRSFTRVLTEPATLIPLLGVTALTAVFNSYLGSTELIIGDVFDRRGQFSIIFGASAAVFGVASLLNSRLVTWFGMNRLLLPVSLFYLSGAVILLGLSLQSSGVPEFWVFMPILSVVLASGMILNPNLNTIAMQPVGDIAGTASSIIGAIALGCGSLVGSMIDRQFQGTVMPYTVALVISALIVFALCWRLRSVNAAPDL